MKKTRETPSHPAEAMQRDIPIGIDPSAPGPVVADDEEDPNGHPWREHPPVEDPGSP